MTIRCPWARSEQEIRYHDLEWGVPSFDDRHLFEMLVLEGAQAGLSWSTVLAKRDRYRQVYDEFEPHRVMKFDTQKRAALLADPGIIRNRLKVDSSIQNAAAFVAVQRELGSFACLLWGYVEGRPIINRWASASSVPATTPLSDRISKDLKRRGFRFVGPTIIYAYLQAVGVVNDHLVDCPRHHACQAMAEQSPSTYVSHG